MTPNDQLRAAATQATRTVTIDRMAVPRTRYRFPVTVARAVSQAGGDAGLEADSGKAVTQ